jgi:hypothetical protein
MTTLQATVRLKVERRRLYLPNLEHFKVFLKRSLKKLEPLSVSIYPGAPNLSTTFNTNALATVSASCWGTGTATKNLLKSSWNVNVLIP